MKASDIAIQYLEQADADGEIVTQLKITNTGDRELGEHWRLYFSLGLKLKDEARFTRTLLEGRYGFLSPTSHYTPIAPGDHVLLNIEPWLFSGMALIARQGFFITSTSGSSDAETSEELLGEPTELPPLLAPLTAPRHPMIEQLSRTPNYLSKPLPAAMTGTDEVIPALKEYARTDAQLAYDAFTIVADRSLSNEAAFLKSALADKQTIENGIPILLEVNQDLTATYELTTTDTGIAIIGQKAEGVFWGIQSFLQLSHQVDDRWHIPKLQVSDSPDFDHRGLYIDLARHFHHAAALQKIITAMSRYKMNRLILGVANDEAWRLEIAGIPELTDIGAKRGYQQFDSNHSRLALAPAWGDSHHLTTGHLTGADFVALLKHAAQHHVELIVELNMPGHANALLRALEQSKWQLADPADQSSYRSAQGYASNVMNVAMPDTYILAKHILIAVRGYYEEAAVPLQRIHFGGDEVPSGAWLHSPACHSLPVWNSNWDVNDETDAMAAMSALMSYHYQQLKALADRIIPDAETLFWHEMAPHGDQSSTYNVWVAEKGGEDVIRQITGRSQKMIVSNASYLYLDMPYAMAADEPGLPWASYVDERAIYFFDPIKSWQLDAADIENVQGIQAQLWTETVFSEELLDYYLFPRLLAVAERGWNRIPVPDHWPDFAAALQARELPYLDSLGIRYRQP